MVDGRSSGLQVRGFRGRGDLERGPGSVGSVGAGRGGVAQQVGSSSEGIARAVLSERYRFVDNLDVLLAVLDGIRSAGADVEVGGVT